MNAATAPTVGLLPTVDDRRQQRAWYFYDWAVSAHSLTVVSVFFGPYATSLARAAADPQGMIHPFGLVLPAAVFFPYLVGLSALTQVVCVPVLGAIADHTHIKKHMLALWAAIGSAATIAMFFLQGDAYVQAGVLYLLAAFGASASTVFYNAFLPDIASPDRRDAVSSNGWALGYLGGGLLLALNVVLLGAAPALGLTTGDAVRISLASAGAWWALFSLVPLTVLRNRRPTRRLGQGENYLTVGFRQVRTTLAKARAYPQTLLFLTAYTIYGVGIGTVLTLAAQFGQEEMGLPIATVTTALLMVQFVAFPCGIAAGRLARVVGTKRTIVLSLLVWVGVVLFTALQMHSATDFFIAAGLAGTVIGGSQALSRSLYSQMIPLGQESEYFALAEVCARAVGWLGPFAFGLSFQLTGSYRAAILVTVVFFVVGLALLWPVDVCRAAIEAGNDAPSRA